MDRGESTTSAMQGSHVPSASDRLVKGRARKKASVDGERALISHPDRARASTIEVLGIIGALKGDFMRDAVTNPPEGQLLQLAPGIDVKPSEHLLLEGAAPGGIKRSAQPDQLVRGRRGEGYAIVGHVGDPPAHARVEVLMLPAEDANGSVVCAQKPDQAPERGGLARPVSPEKADHTALRNREVQPTQGVHLAESLGYP